MDEKQRKIRKIRIRDPIEWMKQGARIAKLERVLIR